MADLPSAAAAGHLRVCSEGRGHPLLLMAALWLWGPRSLSGLQEEYRRGGVPSPLCLMNGAAVCC